MSLKVPEDASSSAQLCSHLDSMQPASLHFIMLTHSLILLSDTLHICSFVIITNSLLIYRHPLWPFKYLSWQVTLTLPIERDLTKSFYMLLLSNNELHVFHCFPPPLSNWPVAPCSSPHTHIHMCTHIPHYAAEHFVRQEDLNYVTQINVLRNISQSCALPVFWIL